MEDMISANPGVNQVLNVLPLLPEKNMSLHPAKMKTLILHKLGFMFF